MQIVETMNFIEYFIEILFSPVKYHFRRLSVHVGD